MRLSLLALLLSCACGAESSRPLPEPADAGPPDAGSADAGGPALCLGQTDCEPDGWCVAVGDGKSFCFQRCDPNGAPCPADKVCAALCGLVRHACLPAEWYALPDAGEKP